MVVLRDAWRRTALALAAVAVAGCGASGGTPAAGPPAGPPDLPAAMPTPTAAVADPSAAPECPPAPADAFPPGLPAAFPTAFPAPPGAAQAVGEDTDPLIVRVRFPSPVGLRESVAFVVERLPAAGFAIVGGDREPHEADIVFAGDGRRGQLRIARIDECTTYWLVQVDRPA